MSITVIKVSADVMEKIAKAVGWKGYTSGDSIAFTSTESGREVKFKEGKKK